MNDEVGDKAMPLLLPYDLYQRTKSFRFHFLALCHNNNNNNNSSNASKNIKTRYEG
jgi:hypothetical protein